MYLQKIDGQTIETLTPTGADFSLSIRAIQIASQEFQNFKKINLQELLSCLQSFVQFFANDPQMNPQEQKNFVNRTRFLWNELPPNIPSGPALIYGSRSSFLLRTIPLLHALSQKNTVIFLLSPENTSIYHLFYQKLLEFGLPAKALTLLTTTDPEAWDTLIHHPAIKTFHFSGHPFESRFFKKESLPFFRKKIKIHLGGTNPVIWTYDAPDEWIAPLLHLSLDTTSLSEHRFHRWFVQEKNYPDFLKKVETILSHLPAPTYFSDLYKEQWEEQKKKMQNEKNWSNKFSFLFNPDFSNCSPWHQQEGLAPLLTLTRFKNTNEAIKFANTTSYASASAVFSGTQEKSMQITQQLIMPHAFNNSLPNMGALDSILGLPECGIGFEIDENRFFSFAK